METVSNYSNSPEKLINHPGKNKFTKNSKVNSFRGIIGVGGRRTGWTGPSDLRRDSVGLVDVRDFFSKELSPASQSGHRIDCKTVKDADSRNGFRLTVKKCPSHNEKGLGYSSQKSYETIPVSPPLCFENLENRNTTHQTMSEVAKVPEVIEIPHRDSSPAPMIDNKDLMLSKSISFYEKLESSLMISSISHDNIDVQRNQQNHHTHAERKVPRSPSASNTDFSLDSLINEVKSPLKARNHPKRSSRRASNTNSDMSLYSNFKFIQALTPKTPVEKFSINSFQDLSSDSLEDYSIKLSSVASQFSSISSSGITSNSENNTSLSESLGSSPIGKTVDAIADNDIKSCQEKMAMLSSNEPATPSTPKPLYKSRSVQASPMVLKKAPEKKEHTDPILPPVSTCDLHSKTGFSSSENMHLTQINGASPQPLYNQNGRKISSPNPETVQSLYTIENPHTTKNTSPSASLEPLTEQLHASPVNIAQDESCKMQDKEYPGRINATLLSNFHSPTYITNTQDEYHSLSPIKNHISPSDHNNIEVPLSHSPDTPPFVQECLHSPLASIPSPLPQLAHNSSDFTGDQMQRPQSVHKSFHKSTYHKPPLVQNTLNKDVVSNTNSSPQEKPKRKRGRPRKIPLPKDTQSPKKSELPPLSSKTISDDERPDPARYQLEQEITLPQIPSPGEYKAENSSINHKRTFDASKKPRKPRRSGKLNSLPQFTFESSEPTEGGTRRSRRMRIKRLRFWEGERVILGRNESGFYPVPVVKEIIRRDENNEKAEEEKQKQKKRDQTRQNKMKRSQSIPKPVTVYNIVTGQEDKQHIVATPEMLNPRTVGTGDYKFQKIFSEGRFFASGMLVMPRGSEKPNKNSNRSAMIFFIVSGEVEVQIHKTKFVLRTGSQFFVPRGNQYRLVNIGTRECKLFFCHGKEVPTQDVTM